MKYDCTKCEATGEVKDMVLKMGGLLCPHCRRIIFAPYVDDVYFEELKRRRDKDDQWE